MSVGSTTSSPRPTADTAARSPSARPDGIEQSKRLRAHQRFGAHPLDEAGCDAYVADTARIATALGAVDPPRDRAALTSLLTVYRQELRATPEALEAARFILRDPPLPWAARAPYALLAANAVSLLPPWAPALFGLRPATGPRATCVRLSGHALTRTIRWAMAPPPRVVP